MQTIPQSQDVSKGRYWTGFAISLLIGLLLFASGATKISMIDPVREGITLLGYPGSVTPATGMVLILCALIYLIPKTSILGAILLTGYLGGATAIHVRVGDSFIFPIILGVLVWGAIYIRDPQLQKLIPLRR
jgi:hypothetical protein